MDYLYFKIIFEFEISDCCFQRIKNMPRQVMMCDLDSCVYFYCQVQKRNMLMTSIGKPRYLVSIEDTQGKCFVYGALALPLVIVRTN